MLDYKNQHGYSIWDVVQSIYTLLYSKPIINLQVSRANVTIPYCQRKNKTSHVILKSLKATITSEGNSCGKN